LFRTLIENIAKLQKHIFFENYFLIYDGTDVRPKTFILVTGQNYKTRRSKMKEIYTLSNLLFVHPFLIKREMMNYKHKYIMI